MPISQIDTGYKPEFGLGALYQGFNAANSDQASELELIKQFLANQREQQMQPIDVSQAQQNLETGQYKTTPEYQTGMRDTISGQGMSNLAAGKTAASLQPFMQKEKIRESENAFERADQQNSIYQLDNLIQVEQNPIQRMALINERNRITRNLRETPEFTGKRELKETGTDSAEYIAELKAEFARRLAAEKAAVPPKPLTMSQMEALYRDRLAKDPNDAEAKQFLAEYERFKQTTQPGMGNVTIDPVTKKLTTVGGNLGSGPATQKPDPLGIR